MKRGRLIIIGIVVAALIIAALLATVDLAALGRALSTADYRWLPVMIVFSALGLLVRGARWRFFLNGRLPLRDCLHISNIGYMLNNLLPLRAGELARVLLASGKTPPIPPMTTISTILLERIVDVLFIFGMLGIALTALPVPDVVGIGGLGLLIFSLAAFVVLFIGVHRRAWLIAALRWFEKFIPFLRRIPIESQLDRFLDGLSSLTTPNALLLTLVWTAICWAMSTASSYSLLLAFFGTADWSVVLLFSALSSLTVSAAAVVAYTPAGIGPYHATVVVALTIAGLTQPEGAPVAYAIVLHGVNLVVVVALGLIGLAQESVTFGDLLRGIRESVGGQKTAASEANHDGTLPR